MRDRILTVATGLVGFAKWANIVVAAGFATGIILSFVFGGMLGVRLATKYPTADIGMVLFAMRLLAVMAIIGAAALHQIFTRLLAIVATVRQGDPFVGANAERLHRIGWALLVLQLLDLALGAVVALLDRLGVEHATWTPALTGWIAVVMIFVLARVFRVGAAMRDDLAMTV